MRKTATVTRARTAHAAVVARHLQRPWVVVFEELLIDERTRRCRRGDQWLDEGTRLKLDGDNGRMYAVAP